MSIDIPFAIFPLRYSLCDIPFAIFPLRCPLCDVPLAPILQRSSLEAVDELFADPAVLVGCEKQNFHSEMFEQPLPTRPDVVIVVDSRQPHRPSVDRTGLKQLPLAGGLVSLHVDDGVHDVMNRKLEGLRGAFEKRPDGFASFEFANTSALPYRIFRVEGRDSVRVIVGIAVVAVLMLQLFDRFDVLDQLNPLFQIVDAHFTLLLCSLSPAVLRAPLARIYVKNPTLGRDASSGVRANALCAMRVSEDHRQEIIEYD